MKGLAPVPEPAEGEDPKKPSKERKVALADRKQGVRRAAARWIRVVT